MKNNGGKQFNKIIPIAFQTMLDNTGDMVFVKDINSVYIAASEPFVKMVGKDKIEDILNKTDFDIFENQDLAKRYVADDKRLLEKGRNLVEYMEPIPDENGSARYGSTSKYILRDEEGNQIGILGITKDITREYIARQHYQQEIRYLFELPEDTYAVTYIDVDEWRIISQRKQNINNNTYQTVHSVEELSDCAYDSIVDKHSKAAQFYYTFTQGKLRQIFESGRSSISFEYQRTMPDGSMTWIQNKIRFLIDVDSGHLCAMLSARDISQEKKEKQKLVMAAKIDHMTSLLNRETTMDYIRELLDTDTEGHHALLMIDVDNFKSLNDTYGHQSGDEFLIELATEISNNFRDSDIIGRIGGDEFFALMKGAPNVSIVARKAQELLAAVNSLCEKYPKVKLSISIGISIYPENGKSLDELYAQADAALYEAKHKGKNQYTFA
ncbi:MAG: diguanylate cyclase [Lachnospiraceae bacterium]|nr:diguanylate cyclase [Lachnospiraceae bacterium]